MDVNETFDFTFRPAIWSVIEEEELSELDFDFFCQSLEVVRMLVVLM
jgi:hypothetical protein